ncbi:cytochrome b [Marinimicrobium sp. ARAG 43.8]|uniref:cytochrome b n=1 Tax=Marinimicrobium sp. ARAG 43.8 TaxID=3418719 RepID=UPI003CF5FE44
MIYDSKERYGVITRVFHWGMAILIFWQMLTVASRVALEDTAVEAFFWATHKPLGALLLVLIALRIVWALLNLSRRPPSVSLGARLGHIVLYALMLAIPVIGLLRQYGSGRSFEPFGIALFSGFETPQIEWMVSLGNQIHGSLGWLLFVLIAGHIIMAYWHKRPGHVDVMRRIVR